MATHHIERESPIIDPGHPVDYSSQATPPTYRCGGCGATGCKLWRDYQTFLNHQTLRCAQCAGENQTKDVSQMGEDGRYPSSDLVGHKTDQIGWLVPAVPTQENDTFWGYSSVPDEGVEWWQKLPTFPS